MVATEPGTALAKPSALGALGLVIGTVALIAGFVLLCSALGNEDYHAGFLFLLCWMMLDRAKLEKLPHAVMGAGFGLMLGYVHLLISSQFGESARYLFGPLLLPIIYCLFMGWLRLVVNFTAMTFLAVTTIPVIQTHGDFRNMAIALALGALYFGVIFALADRLMARRKSVLTGS